MHALDDPNGFDFAKVLLAFFYILSHVLKGELHRLSDFSPHCVSVKV